MARKSLGDARPADAQPLCDVYVAAEPPLGADDEDRLEVVLRGLGRQGAPMCQGALFVGFGR